MQEDKTQILSIEIIKLLHDLNEIEQRQELKDIYKNYIDSIQKWLGFQYSFNSKYKM